MPRWNPQNELEREPRRQRCAPFKTTRTRCAIILLHYGALDAARLEASIGSCPRTRQGEGGSGWRASLQSPSLRQREGGVRGEGEGRPGGERQCHAMRARPLFHSTRQLCQCSAVLAARRGQACRPRQYLAPRQRGRLEGRQGVAVTSTPRIRDPSANLILGRSFAIGVGKSLKTRSLTHMTSTTIAVGEHLQTRRAPRTQWR